MIASPGWSTKDEANALGVIPYVPQVLVLSYYPNDIEESSLVHGERFPSDVVVEPAFLKPLVDHSDFANFLYWRMRHSAMLGLTSGS